MAQEKERCGEEAGEKGNFAGAYPVAAESSVCVQVRSRRGDGQIAVLGHIHKMAAEISGSRLRGVFGQITNIKTDGHIRGY